MATFYKAPSENFVSTTLNGSITDSDTTITVNDASKLQAPGTIVVNRQDGNGTDTPSSREVIHYTGISSNDLTGCTRGEEGSTARAHADSSLVEATFTVEMFNDLRDAVNTALAGNAAGTAIIASTVTISTLLNASGASILGIDNSTLENITVTGTADFERLTLTSVASLAQVRSGDVYNTGLIDTPRLSVTSIASITRLEAPRVEYAVSRMALSSNASGGVACDFDSANLFSRVLQANTTISLENWSTGDKGVIRVIQDGTGSRTVDWYPGSGATVRWVDSTEPTLTTTANKVDSFGFIGATDTQLDGYVIGQDL